MIERGSRRYFGGRPYPFDMELVERRDGTPLGELVRRHFAGVEAVVDAGCGYGRYTEILAESAQAVIALDHSFACVTRTCNRVESALGICGNVSAIPLPSESVDGVISLYTSIGLDGEDLSRQIGEFTRVTRSGGRLLLDVAAPGTVGFSFGAERIPWGVGLFLRIGGQAQQLQINLAVSLSRVGVYRLLYATYRAEDILTALTPGWIIEQTLGDYDGSPYSVDSARIIVSAQRS